MWSAWWRGSARSVGRCAVDRCVAAVAGRWCGVGCARCATGRADACLSVGVVCEVCVIVCVCVCEINGGAAACGAGKVQAAAASAAGL